MTTTNAYPFVMPLFWPLDANKDFMVGWKLSAYIAGTDTKKDTYSDPACSTANDWPLVGNADGFAMFYLKPGEPYKLSLTDADDVLQPGWPIDNICYTKAMVGLSNVTNDAQVKASIGTAKGDLIGFTASATPTNIAVGTNGQVLTAASGSSAGMSWQSIGTNIIDTQSVTSVSTIDFSVDTLTRYKLIVQVLQNTSNGYLKLTCNGDTGNNYSYVIAGRYSTGATLVYGNAGSFIALSDTTAGNLILAANEAYIEIELSTWQSNPHKALFTVKGSWVNISGNPGGCSGSGTYSGAADVTTISIVPSAGTITGVATLYSLN